jgi:hypothetical protein
VKSAFAKLNAPGLRILMEEASNPQFLKKRLGISGGAVSQDQDYLNGHPAALKAREAAGVSHRGRHGNGQPVECRRQRERRGSRYAPKGEGRGEAA